MRGCGGTGTACLVMHALSLTLALSHKERERRSPRAESPGTSSFARGGRRLSLPQRGRAGVREKSGGFPAGQNFTSRLTPRET